MSDFAKNLKKYRKQNKFSQAELAKVLHYGYTAIANYESGRNEPSFDDLIMLSYTLHVTPNDLIGFSDTEDDREFLASFKRLLPDTDRQIFVLQQKQQILLSAGHAAKC